MEGILFIKLQLTTDKLYLYVCIYEFKEYLIYTHYILQVISLHLYKNKRSYSCPEGFAENFIIIREHVLLQSISLSKVLQPFVAS